MIRVEDKALCCGCTACAVACPAGCITMAADAEGFLYPQVAGENCLHCGKCLTVCPIRNPVPRGPFAQKGYIVQHRDAGVLRESTAGGAFTAIAKYALDRGGVVFGATLDERLTVRHTWVAEETQLGIFRGSKYVQSDLGDAFRQVKAFLEGDRTVCFSGTPCQVEGLRAFLGRAYENLILVDMVCHGVPSPLAFQKYLQYQENRQKAPVKAIRFRDKHYGYQYSTVCVTAAGKSGYHRGAESDPWLRAFLSGICDRPSCHACAFRQRYRGSDLTLWDCFSVGEFSRELDNGKGATRVLIHSPKGRAVFAAIRGQLRYIEVLPEKLVSGVREMFHSAAPDPKRAAFFADARHLPGPELFAKYFPEMLDTRLERLARLTCLYLGIYGPMKKLYFRLLGRKKR